MDASRCADVAQVCAGASLAIALLAGHVGQARARDPETLPPPGSTAESEVWGVPEGVEERPPPGGWSLVAAEPDFDGVSGEPGAVPTPDDPSFGEFAFARLGVVRDATGRFVRGEGYSAWLRVGAARVHVFDFVTTGGPGAVYLERRGRYGVAFRARPPSGGGIDNLYLAVALIDLVRARRVGAPRAVRAVPYVEPTCGCDALVMEAGAYLVPVLDGRRLSAALVTFDEDGALVFRGLASRGRWRALETGDHVLHGLVDADATDRGCGFEAEIEAWRPPAVLSLERCTSARGQCAHVVR